MFMAVRAADRVLLFDAAGKQKAAYTIPADLRGRSFTFYDLNNGNALLSVGGDEFVWINAAGNVLKRKKVALENSRANDFPPQVALAAPAPIEIGLVIATDAAQRVESGESSSYAAGLRWSFSLAWPVLLAVSILARARLALLPAATAICATVDRRVGCFCLCLRSAGLGGLSLPSPLAGA